MTFTSSSTSEPTTDPANRTSPEHLARVPRFRLSTEADARTRTGDPFITSEVLYQLSYVGEDG